MKKIDTHVHAALVKTPSRGGDPRHPEQHYIATPQELRAHLEAQCIGHAVLMSSGEAMGASGCANNAGCQAIAAAHPGFFPGCATLTTAIPQPWRRGWQNTRRRVLWAWEN